MCNNIPTYIYKKHGTRVWTGCMKDFLTTLSSSRSNRAGTFLITNTTSIPYLLVLNGARNRRCVVVMWLQMQMVSSRVHAAWRQHLAIHPHTILRQTFSRNTTQHKLNIQDHSPAAATGRGGRGDSTSLTEVLQ